jgi:hypothetical protein
VGLFADVLFGICIAIIPEDNAHLGKSLAEMWPCFFRLSLIHAFISFIVFFQCDGGECRAGSVPGGDGGFGCSLAGEYCEDDGECCEDDIEFLVCFARECRPFTSSANACAGRGDFCIDDFDCCGGGFGGGLICALDNSCQRAITNERCSASAGSHCSGNEDCCGRDLQCGPNKRCSRIYTGVGYP